MQQDSSGGNVVSETPAERPAPLSDPLLDHSSPFINVLVTPKITFSVPRKTGWTVADDISQEDLRAAFLTRFPIQFDTSRLTFTCATPSRRLSDISDCVVFRIGAESAKEERVLLSILSEIDKAYSAKYEKLLEEARADLLSSTLNFQVLADEIKEGQQAAAKRWEKDVRSLKDQLATNQKRLFLLEQEKETLQRTASSADSMAGRLRRDLAHVSSENLMLKERMGDMESQFLELRECLASQQFGRASECASARSEVAVPECAFARSEVAVQTTDSQPQDSERHLAAERWQRMDEQFKAMSQWMQTGADLLRDGPAPPQPQSTAGHRPQAAATPLRVVPPNTKMERVALLPRSALLAPNTKWSELPSDESEG